MFNSSVLLDELKRFEDEALAGGSIRDRELLNASDGTILHGAQSEDPHAVHLGDGRWYRNSKKAAVIVHTGHFQSPELEQPATQSNVEYSIACGVA